MTGPRLAIWTDGACRGNPGPGGYAAIVADPDGGPGVLRHGGRPRTTNNVMELGAALVGLRSVPDGARVVVVTDSKYLVQGMTEWAGSWIRRGWRTATGAPVKNGEVWRALLAEAERLGRIDWRWTKGHAGDPLNNLADRVAQAAADAAARDGAERNDSEPLREPAASRARAAAALLLAPGANPRTPEGRT